MTNLENSSELAHKKPVMMIEEILRHMPQRYPFVLLDRVLDMGDNHIVAQKNVTFNEAFFQGHFPKKAVFPGVLMLEAMAQACAVYGFSKKGLTAEEYVIFFVGTDKTRFRRQVVPGDVMIIHSQMASHRRGFWNFEARIEVDGQVACESNILCTYQRLGNSEDKE